MPAFYYLQAAALGFSAAAMPGPFQAFLIETATRRGYKAAALAALAPLLSDGPIIIIATLVLSRLPAWCLPLLRVVGGTYVLYLALYAYLALRNLLPESTGNAPSTSKPSSALQAATINLLSPGVYLFWSTVSGPLLIEGWRQHPVVGLGFLALFYGAMILSSLALVLGVARLAAVSKHITHAIQAASVLLMWAFAEIYLWQGLTTLFR